MSSRDKTTASASSDSLDLKTHNTTRDSLGLFYIFCDESVVNLDCGKRFLTAHVAVPQSAWNSVSEAQRNLVEPVNVLQLDRVRKLLEDTNGLAIIAYADVPLLYLPAGEQDTTGDIRNMSRTDHIWSVALAFGMTSTFKWLTLHGLLLRTFDVYYDTHSMKGDHRKAWATAVTERLPKVISKVTSEEHKPEVRRFCDTPKAPRGSPRDNFQAGIAVCDWLLNHATEIIQSGDQKRIHVRNNSEQMASHLNEAFLSHGETP